MKRLALAVVLLIIGFAALAQTPPLPNPCDNISATAENLGLNSNQLKTLASSCQNVEKPVIETVTSPKVVAAANKWSGVAKEFAQAIGIAAKELGIAVNDFLDSPAGYLMAAILLVKYAGAITIGIPFTLFSGWMLYFVLYKLRIHTIDYEYRSAFWGLFEYRRKLKVTMRNELPEHVAVYGLVAIIFTLASNITVWANLN